MKKIQRKSLLYKSGVEYADFCLNHVEGCSHGCMFPCYAWQMAKRFGRVKKDSDWLKPKLVENALDLLDKEIPKYKDQINFVHLCFMTDPFMYGQKEVIDLTLQIIARLNKDNIRCTVLTKGVLPSKLRNVKIYSSKNEYGITLVSLNHLFKNRYEKNSAPYASRITALKRLHDVGLKTWVSIEPYPTPNLDTNQNLGKLLNSVAFVDRIIFGKLNYNVVSSQFKENIPFYEDCAKQVIEFCKRKGIDYHIKFGTQETFNKNTVGLFGRVCNPPISV
ncbi:MAG: radical SAM protein [Nanoarchaeota archaeon]|nr:radical SAM protein [Nanoarchaeota archaeon]